MGRFVMKMGITAAVGHRPRTTKARWTVDSMEKFGNQKLTKISKNTNNNF